MKQKKVFVKAGILLLLFIAWPGLAGCGAISSLIATPTLTATLAPTVTVTPTQVVGVDTAAVINNVSYSVNGKQVSGDISFRFLHVTAEDQSFRFSMEIEGPELAIYWISDRTTLVCDTHHYTVTAVGIEAAESGVNELIIFELPQYEELKGCSLVVSGYVIPVSTIPQQEHK